MCSERDNAALPALGFPIRESTDHRLFSAYPWLIAAVHALHRLLVPRHPPCALLILTVILIRASTRQSETRGDTRYIGKTVQFSRTALKNAGGTRRRSLKTQQHASDPSSRMRRCVQTRSTLLGPAGSARRVVRREGRSGAPILETSLERR